MSACALLAASSAWAPVAWAGNGLNPLSQSPKAVARGGAGAAVAESGLSATHNPALLADLGTRVDTGYMWLGERVRVVDDEGNHLEEDWLEVPVPLASFVWDPLGTAEAPSDLRLALGLHHPTLFAFSPAFSAAVRLNDSFSVGASLEVPMTLMSFDFTGSVGGGGGSGWLPGGDMEVYRDAGGNPIPPTPFIVGGEQATWGELFALLDSAATTSSSGDDQRSLVSVKDLFGVGLAGQLGCAWTPRDDLTLALAVRTPGIVFEPRGNGRVTLTHAIRALESDPDTGPVIGGLVATYLPDGGAYGFDAKYDVRVESVILPPSVSLGAAWWPLPGWLVTADLRWIGWDMAFDAFVIKGRGGKNTDLNEINGSRTLRFEFELDWNDQYVLALGTAVAVTDWCVLRAGLNQGNSPVPKSTMVANSLTVETHLTVGATFRWANWELDLSYVWGLPTRERRIPGSVFRAEQHVIALGVGCSL